MASTVWRGFLTFGLVSLPIRLFRGARAERIPLRQVARRLPLQREEGKLDTSTTPELDNRTSGNQWVPAHQHLVARGAEKLVEPQAVSKAFEVRKDEFIEVNKEELKQLRSKTSSAMVINEFVALDDIDPIFLESSFYVAPEEVGEKAYALLFLGLQKAGLVALAEVAMHGREHIIALRPGRTGLLAHTLYYLNEVHVDEEFVADPALASPKELGLVTQLIHSLTTTFDAAKYGDRYRERLQCLIDGKLHAADGTALPESSKRRPVVDITEALQRSLKELRKPARRQSAESEKPSGKSRRTANGGA